MAWTFANKNDEHPEDRMAAMNSPVGGEDSEKANNNKGYNGKIINFLKGIWESEFTKKNPLKKLIYINVKNNAARFERDEITTRSLWFLLSVAADKGHLRLFLMK